MIDREILRLLNRIERDEYPLCPYKYKPFGFRAERNRLIIKLFIATGIPLASLTRLKKKDVIFNPPLNCAIRVRFFRSEEYIHEMMLPGLDEATSKLQWREELGYRLTNNYWCVRNDDWLFPSGKNYSKSMLPKTASDLVRWSAEYSPTLKRNMLIKDIGHWNISMVMRRLEHKGVNRMDIVNNLRPAYIYIEDSRGWENHYTREELLRGAVMPVDSVLPVEKYWYLYKTMWEVERKRHNLVYKKHLLGYIPRHKDYKSGGFTGKIDLTRDLLSQSSNSHKAPEPKVLK